MRIFIFSYIILLMGWDVQFLICKLSQGFVFCLFIMVDYIVMWQYNFKGRKKVLKEVAEIILTHKDDVGNHFRKFEP